MRAFYVLKRAVGDHGGARAIDPATVAGYFTDIAGAPWSQRQRDARRFRTAVAARDFVRYPPGARIVRVTHRTPILRTQAEVDAHLRAETRVGHCVPVLLAPTEPINLDYWIKPHECCSMCGEATPGLRMNKPPAKGPREDCSACKDTGMLITTWGTPQTDRWLDGLRYDRPDEEEDDGPQVAPIRVMRGSPPKYVRSLRRQADRALIKFEIVRASS